MSLQWKAYKTFYGKIYSSEEEDARHYDRFTSSLGYVRAYPKNASFTVGLTKFSDWLNHELETLFQPITESSDDIWWRRDRPDTIQAEIIPASLNWYTADNPLKRPVVTPVRDQQQCGACW
jgi:hypothetical protein